VQQITDKINAGEFAHDLFEAAETEAIGMMKFHSFPLFMQKYHSSTSSPAQSSPGDVSISIGSNA